MYGHNLELPINEKLILNIQESDYKKYEAIIEPLFENNDIDSVIASSEQSAIAAMKIAQRKGYKVPENFSVIGFANGLLSRHSNPKLTTVSQHGERMGETAAQMLIDRLEKSETDIPTVTKVIKTDLVERNSTKSYLELSKHN